MAILDNWKEKTPPKRLEELLHERIAEAEKSFRPETQTFLIWKKAPKDPLAFNKVAIKGVGTAASAGLAALQAPEIYQIGAKVGLALFERYFNETFLANLASNRGAADTLSYYLVRDDKVGSRYKANVARMRYNVQATIYAVAGFLEEQKMSLEAARTTDLDPAKQRQIKSFVEANHQWRTSYRSMATALKLFVEENADILRRLQRARETGSEDRRRLFQLNAVFAYEVADAIIGFTRAFQLQGISELKRLHDEIMKEVERGKQQLKALEQQIMSARRSHAIDDDRFSRSSAGIDGRRRALDLIQARWTNLLRQLAESEKNSLQFFGSIIQKLEIIKLEAQANLTVTGLVDITGAVQENFMALEDMVNDIDKLEVVPITDEDVSIFLNFDGNVSLAT